MMETATVFGMIWGCVIIASGTINNAGMESVVDLYGRDPGQAGTVWLAIESVLEGLGGSNEILGGIWILLISWVAVRAGEFPKFLNYLGMAVGVAGDRHAAQQPKRARLMTGYGDLSGNLLRNRHLS